MAHQRRSNFAPATTSSHASTRPLDASTLRIDDDDHHPRQRHAASRDYSPDSADEEEELRLQHGRRYTQFYTQDGVRLYRPSDEEYRLTGRDPRDGPPAFFADDEPWIPPELRTNQPPPMPPPQQRRGRSPTTRARANAPVGENDGSSQESGESDSGSNQSPQGRPTRGQRGVPAGAHESNNPSYLPGARIPSGLPAQAPAGSQGSQGGRHHYPAYDDPTHRIGLEHVRNPSSIHQADKSYYLERTQHYPTDSSFPHVMAVDIERPPEMRRSRRHKDKAVDPGGSIMSVDEPQSRSGRAQGGAQAQTSDPGNPDDVPDASPYLRDLLGLGPDDPISLDCLKDPPRGEKPNYPYPTLVQLAIYGSPGKRLTLSEIYSTLEARYDWFRNTPDKTKWQGSIRHNLSLNKVFRQIPRPISCPGKGNWWVVDYSRGEGNKRERKRNRKPTKSEMRKAAEEDEDEDDSDEESDQAQPPPRSLPAGYTGKFRSGPAPAGRAPPGMGANSGPAINPMFIVPNPTRGTSNPAPPPFDESNIDPVLRGQGHLVGGGPPRAVRSSPRQTASPYSASTPIRRSTRNQNQEGGSSSPGPDPRYGQSAYGAPSNSNWSGYGGAVPSGLPGVASNNALGLGFNQTASSSSSSSPASAPRASTSSYPGAPPRRSAREAAGPGHSLPSALNGGKRTYNGSGHYRERHDDDDD